MSESRKPTSSPAADQERALPLRDDPRLQLPAPAASPGGGSAVPIITPTLVLHAVRRWWKWASPFALLFSAAAGAAVWFYFVPQFQSSRLIQIKDNVPYIAFPQGGGESTRFARTEMAIIKSRVVLDPVVQRKEIARIKELQESESPVDWISARLRISPVEGSEIYNVRFEGPNPDDTHRIVDAVIEEYVKLRKQTGSASTTAMKEQLQKILAEREVQLAQMQQKVIDASKDVTDEVYRKGLILPKPTQFARMPGEFSHLQTELTNLQVDRTMLEATRDTMASQMKDFKAEVSDETINELLSTDERSRNIQQRIAETQAKLAKRVATAAPGHRDSYISSLESLIAADKEKLAERQEELRPQITEQIEKKVAAERMKRISEIERQIEGKNAAERVLNKKMEEFRKKMDSQSTEAMELDFALANLGQARAVYNRISQRLEKMETEEEAPGRIVTEIFPAAQRGTPTKKHKIPRIIMASVAGFGFPFFLAVLWEMKTRRIGASDEIPGETPIKVIGELSELPTRPSRLRLRSRYHYNYYRNTFEESVDYLRTSLLLSDQFNEMRVVAVASAVSREGKTSLASHLAVSVARATKEPTLLIDADMRNPSIDGLFDVSLSPGLAELLDGTSKFDEAIARDSVPYLHILPAGQLSKSPHVLLGNGALSSIVDEARRRYRYVIVDSPPVLPVSDALVIARACDGTLISTMRDVSRGPQVRRACERLKSAGAHLIGAVLSGVPPETYSSHYGPYAYPYQRYGSNRTAPSTTNNKETS